jgi:flagellar hook-length control protein FliK
MMMAGSPAIRIATHGGSKAQEAAPAPERSGFPAALMAATATGPRTEAAGAGRAGGDAAPAAGRDARDAAGDPGVAAALAALFPAIPAAVPPPAGEEAAAEALDLGELAGTGQGEDPLQALEFATDAIEVAPDTVVEPGADAGDELLRNLAKELALARDSATAERAPIDARPSSGIEAPSGSASSHAATQLSALATATATPAAAAAEQAALRSPVGSPRWAEELGSRLVMMSTRGPNEGSLSLAPEHLGPLEVRISMHQQTANVWFGAHHADTRAALAEALPRLREMLAEAGLSLGHSGVSQEAPRHERRQSEALHSGDAPAGTALPLAPAAPRALSGLLDLYA